MRILIVSLLGLFLIGCATPIYTKWNLTREEWNKDYYECKQQGFSGSMGNIFIANNLQTQCLEQRGYYRQK